MAARCSWPDRTAEPAAWRWRAPARHPPACDRLQRIALEALYSTDLADTQARIEAAGGRIIRPVFDFPGRRRFHFADHNGYELAVWSEG